MTYDYELTLVGTAENTEDEIGNQITVEERTTILCGIKSISLNEFYKAAAGGLRPEIVFLIHGFEYSGQIFVEYENQRYRVIRTYSSNMEEMELTCGKVGR